ncbi:MAG: hypothetical protein ACOYON_14085 [Fimbriimonas sp.]
MGLLGLAYLASLFVAGRGLSSFWFDSARWSVHPWSLLTYPLAARGSSGGGIIFTIFMLVWLYYVGGAIEREVGRFRHSMFVFFSILLGSLGLLLGSLASAVPVVEGGPSLLVATMTVAWGGRNPGAIIRLFMILPIAGRWLGWLSAAVVLFSFGVGAPMLGLFALLPIGFAVLFAQDRVPGLGYRQQRESERGKTKAQVAREDAYFDDVKRREIERQERERLRKLFGEDDAEERP